MIPDKNILFDEKRLWGNTKFWGSLLMLLSFGFSYMIVIHLAEGGDVTWFSMFFLYLFAYFYGGWQGMLFAVGFGVLKFFGDMYCGLLDTGHMTAEMLDYLISYGIVGAGGFFSQGMIRDSRKKKGDKKSEEKSIKKRGVYVESIVASDDYQVGSPQENYALKIGYGIAMLLRFISSTVICIVFYYRPENSFIKNLTEGVVYTLAYVGVETVLTYLLLLFPWVCSATEYCKYVATHNYDPDLKTY